MYTPRRMRPCAVAFVCLFLAEAVDGFVSSTTTLPRLGVELSTTAVRTRTARRTATAMTSSTRSKRGQRSPEEEKKRTPREIAGESKRGGRARAVRCATYFTVLNLNISNVQI